ncbi:hypothetical protein EU538_05150 [Candidatus Thorarchaeota archaeon]|nr:MAG: hypothetical protein EU538_05150 [Candidatus Thorarchaeota archaeon]
MPKAMFSIWWDDRLGPMVGRSYPPDEKELSSEDAVAIFMGHGVHQESRIGYCNLNRGLVISLMQPPNCIAVLLDNGDEPQLVERNLQRLSEEVNFNSTDWDTEISRAFARLNELLERSTGDELLQQKDIRTLLQDMMEGRLKALQPRNVLMGVDVYPEASKRLVGSDEEVARTLRDLENAGVIVAKTYGRKIQCRKCGSSEVRLLLSCPNCGSVDLYKVYQLFCPHCGKRTQTVIVDDMREVSCQHCKKSIDVASLNVLDVELLCNSCSTASADPKIVLDCAACGARLDKVDILGGTGLAYYTKMKLNEEE